MCHWNTTTNRRLGGYALFSEDKRLHKVFEFFSLVLSTLVMVVLMFYRTLCRCGTLFLLNFFSLCPHLA